MDRLVKDCGFLNAYRSEQLERGTDASTAELQSQWGETEPLDKPHSHLDGVTR
jgi:hypothetical protein